MLDCFAPRPSAETVSITPVAAADLKKLLNRESTRTVAWLESTGFTGAVGQVAMLPGEKGRLARVFVGADAKDWLWALGDLPSRLPAGRYELDGGDKHQATRAALGWALGGYAFSRYRKRERKAIDLVWPKAADRDFVERTAEAIFLVRDLVNTPAADLGPAELADAARVLARKHKAKVDVIVGEALLKKNFPMVYAVGKGSARAPRLIDMTWGPAKAPRVTLVGKGVCFDSGGLDLKPSSGMKMMKKDMGGAAHALGLAAMIMAAKLPVRLRVVIPAVENMVSGNSFRPLDVIPTRKGKTVEIGNTDAEGRLILADALTLADGDKPALMIDFATLTGAARVALGPDLPAMFTDDDGLAADLARHAEAEADPMWRLPLWAGYREGLSSKVADLNNIAESGFAGAIYAALFLKEFVTDTKAWVHFDLYAWNGRTRPGRPEGGEAMTLRALYALVEDRFGK